MDLRETEVVGQGDWFGEEKRDLPYKEKPLAYTGYRCFFFFFCGSADNKHIKDLAHQGRDYPAHWALLPLIAPSPSLSGPADLRETLQVALPPKTEQSLLTACGHH